MKFKIFIIFVLTLFMFNIDIAKAENEQAVYFYFLEQEHDFSKVNPDKVKLLDVRYSENRDLYHKYLATYDVPYNEQVTPILFSGSNYYLNNDINANITNIGKAKTLTLSEMPIMLYFYSESCTFCIELEPTINAIDDIYIVKYDMAKNYALTLTHNYAEAYNTDPTSPLIIAGPKAFHGLKPIQDGLANGDIKANALESPLMVDYKPLDLSKYQGFWGFFLILGAGLIDGINPCAIAMLIIFISLIFGMSGKKSTLISVAFSFIVGMFITYFLLGAFLMKFLGRIKPLIASFNLFIYIFIIVISIIFLTLNLHDFIVARKNQYGKVKNQLPKGIQKFNQRIMKFVTNNLQNKNLFIIYLFAFGLGVIISLTEFLCTGQVYLPTILILAEYEGFLTGMVVLVFYNLMFVLPLIIITILAVVSQSVMQTSNLVRKNLHWIKLITGGLFFIFAVYYLVKLIEVI